MGKAWAYFQGLFLYIVWAFGYGEAFDYKEAFSYGYVCLSDLKKKKFLLLYPWLKPQEGYNIKW
jgi:hypothetical protein